LNKFGGKAFVIFSICFARRSQIFNFQFSICHLQYSSMFETIKEQLPVAAEKVAHLRRFL